MNADDAAIADALAVLRAGPLATVQDLGRPHHRAWGVPVGGAFDVEGHELANALLGNDPASATIELTLFGGEFRVGAPLALAIAGAPMPVTLSAADDRPGPDRVLRPPACVSARPGDLLRIGPAGRGMRSYLAVRGGWRTPMVLGSRSAEEPLEAGDALPALAGSTPARFLRDDLAPPGDPDGPIRLLDGPDAGRLVDRDWHRSPYRVAASSDRMGLRLDGAAVDATAEADRLSAPVLPGAVQISDGRPLVLGVACGTTGGYPHVAQVISADLPRLAHARPGQPLRFRRASLAEARRLDRDWRARRRALLSRVACASGDPPR